jgi:glycosyltransferase involved in cell wall biosynthesis
MGKRISLGLIFTVNEGWIGGTYYILNLIQALGTLPDRDQPKILILSYLKTDYEAAQQTGYRYLQYHNPYQYKRNWMEALVNKCYKIAFGKNIIDKRLSGKEVSAIFPAVDDEVFNLVPHKIYWMPDFQHCHYPQFFEDWELVQRNQFLSKLGAGKSRLILSSAAAADDWERTPFEKKCPVTVIPFAVTHPPINEYNKELLLQQFGLPSKYFIVCNQFWQHKNHKVVLEAIQILHQSGVYCNVVFTGKPDDYRQPNYYNTLLAYINEKGIASQLHFLGLIDRKAQLCLMQHAIAVIQPSLFEGWSTVVEDAKHLGTPVIASNIAVHKEQLGDEGTFFYATNANALAEHLLQFLQNKVSVTQMNYSLNIKQFGKRFYSMLKSVVEEGEKS